jgi:predicted PurR-regulated permease PerM
VDPEQLNLQDFGGGISKALSKVLAGTKGLLKGIAEQLFTLVVFYFTAIVFFHNSEAITRFFERFLPLAEKDRDKMFRSIRDVTRAVFFGVLVTALVQGGLSIIGFAVTGVPHALVLGAVTFFVSLIPGGPMLIWLPAACYLFYIDVPLWRPIALLVWGAGVVSTADNFIRPIFIGRSVELPMILIFFGVLGGLMAFGIIGLFLGPVILTVFLLLLNVAAQERTSP